MRRRRRRSLVLVVVVVVAIRRLTGGEGGWPGPRRRCRVGDDDVGRLPPLGPTAVGRGRTPLAAWTDVLLRRSARAAVRHQSVEPRWRRRGGETHPLGPGRFAIQFRQRVERPERVSRRVDVGGGGGDGVMVSSRYQKVSYCRVS